MGESRHHKWKRNERERRKEVSPFSGRPLEDFSEWQISALKAQRKTGKTCAPAITNKNASNPQK